MSRIRPLDREDLPAVANIYELVVRSGTAHAPPGLASHFERIVFDQPFSDPELPSLVYDDPAHGVCGFIASYPRPFVDVERPVRIACSGQLVVHPNVRSAGVGALLLRSYLAGPQDVTITDGATSTARAMWEGLGGVTNAMASVGWTRILTPSRFLINELARRRKWEWAPGGRMWTALDKLSGRSLRPATPPASSEPLTTEMLLDGLSKLKRAFPLQPNYDAGSLTWLFREMEAVSPVRGPLVRRSVRDRQARVAGWYIGYFPAGGVAQVVHLAGANAGLVLDELFHHATARGATAVQGRVDPYLYPHLRSRRCLLYASNWALLHARQLTTLGTILRGRALLTRLDGEWWMAPHRLDVETLAQQAQMRAPTF